MLTPAAPGERGPTLRHPAKIAVAGSKRRALAGTRAPAGAGLCPQREHACGGESGSGHPKPARWGVPPDGGVARSPPARRAATGDSANPCAPLR